MWWWYPKTGIELFGVMWYDGVELSDNSWVREGVVETADPLGEWLWRLMCTRAELQDLEMLRSQLGVKEGETIPDSKLESASKKGGKLGKRARLAVTLKKISRRKK